jgi:hypothetical protein
MSTRRRRPTKPTPQDSDPAIRAYYERTGEPFRVAVARLAKTHTMAEAARARGFNSLHTFRYAISVRNLPVAFVEPTPCRP